MVMWCVCIHVWVMVMLCVCIHVWVMSHGTCMYTLNSSNVDVPSSTWCRIYVCVKLHIRVCVMHICDVTPTYVQDSHVCDMTHTCLWRESYIYVTWLMQMWDMTHTYMWHNSYIYATWLIHILVMTHACMWHHSCICVIWRIHICDMTHTYMYMTHTYMWHTHLAVSIGSVKINIPALLKPPRASTHLTTHTCTWHDSYIYMTRTPDSQHRKCKMQYTQPFEPT